MEPLCYDQKIPISKRVKLVSGRGKTPRIITGTVIADSEKHFTINMDTRDGVYSYRESFLKVDMYIGELDVRFIEKPKQKQTKDVI